MITDKYNRKFETLRLSLTPACNFACSYCTPNENLQIIKATSLTAHQYYKRVLQVHRHTPLNVVRLTGGEPTLYKELPLLISLLKKDIKKVKMTTNALKLERLALALALKQAGLDAINISLDSLEQTSFTKINRNRHLDQVLAGIDAALSQGLDVKLNCTVMKGFNENQVVPLLDYAKQKGITIRYLELMKMGHLAKEHQKYFFSEKEILESIAEHYPIKEQQREVSSTARYWQVDNKTQFGIIANHSTPFCGDCNRLRMDVKGKLYGCLSANQGFTVKPDGSNLDKVLSRALAQKQDIHFTGSSLSMKAIGG